MPLEGEIDWDAVYQAYADWEAEGGLPLPMPVKGWRSSGPSSYFFVGERPQVLGELLIGRGLPESSDKIDYLDPGY